MADENGQKMHKVRGIQKTEYVLYWKRSAHCGANGKELLYCRWAKKFWRGKSHSNSRNEFETLVAEFFKELPLQ